MISVLIPFHNEKENLPVLIPLLIGVLKKLKQPFEVILIDDGSTDNSLSVIPKNDYLIVVRHRRRRGKGKALTTGFKASQGDILLFMDADLQDDPADIPLFFSKMKEGYDLVNGWRKERKDSVGKTFPSKIFNFFLLRLLLRSPFHDINCGFKMMRREILQEVPLYGDNYRFLPMWAQREGYKTTEVIVQHHPRKYGVSKYGFWRMFYTIIDIITTYFIFGFVEKPLHFFGPIGVLVGLSGFFTLIYLLVERLFFNMLLYRRPALQIAVLLVIVGVQIIMTGIIGELIVYIHKKNGLERDARITSRENAETR
ncbi:glycosyltransferase family 2 protein [Candidatus Roizmanbacteria bacterium]|nr:glycosyltransferase family 2 protein [Candidatus Roizmanbacteria bacterium]